MIAALGYQLKRSTILRRSPQGVGVDGQRATHQIAHGNAVLLGQGSNVLVQPVANLDDQLVLLWCGSAALGGRRRALVWRVVNLVFRCRAPISSSIHVTSSVYKPLGGGWDSRTWGPIIGYDGERRQLNGSSRSNDAGPANSLRKLRFLVKLNADGTVWVIPSGSFGRDWNESRPTGSGKPRGEGPMTPRDSGSEPPPSHLRLAAPTHEDGSRISQPPRQEATPLPPPSMRLRVSEAGVEPE